MYESISVGIASSGDYCFNMFKENGIIGPHFILPEEWLPGARSVISVFFSLSPRVVSSNAAERKWPSNEWLHARIEGQKFISGAMDAFRDELRRRGFGAVAPSSDPRFDSAIEPNKMKFSGLSYTSVWSERHVAFACGLGTFGLSKGLITKRGVAGRFGSVVTSLDLPVTPRDYAGTYEYCSMCGACARNCPASAITLEGGKNHPICSEFLNQTFRKYSPRCGCGKCQTAVSCQSRRPPGRSA
jgi:epoxyqueuosine reductase QueG